MPLDSAASTLDAARVVEFLEDVMMAGMPMSRRHFSGRGAETFISEL